MALGTKWIQVGVQIRANQTGWESGFEVLSTNSFMMSLVSEVGIPMAETD